MAKSKSGRAHSKKKRRGQKPKKKKGGGMITGMRGGFKNVAGAVTGLDDEKAKKKGNAVVSTIVTLIIVALVAVFLMYR